MLNSLGWLLACRRVRQGAIEPFAHPPEPREMRWLDVRKKEGQFLPLLASAPQSTGGAVTQRSGAVERRCRVAPRRPACTVALDNRQAAADAAAETAGGVGLAP